MCWIAWATADHAKHVQRVELGLAALEREPAGTLQDPLSADGEEPAEIDRARLSLLFAREIASEELVERTRSGVGEVVGHFASSQT